MGHLWIPLLNIWHSTNVDWNQAFLWDSAESIYTSYLITENHDGEEILPCPPIAVLDVECDRTTEELHSYLWTCLYWLGPGTWGHQHGTVLASSNPSKPKHKTVDTCATSSSTTYLGQCIGFVFLFLAIGNGSEKLMVFFITDKPTNIILLWEKNIIP